MGFVQLVALFRKRNKLKRLNPVWLRAEIWVGRSPSGCGMQIGQTARRTSKTQDV